MAALQFGPKCSRTNVYAPLLNRIRPCPRTKSGLFKPFLLSIYLEKYHHFALCFISSAFKALRLILPIAVTGSSLRNAISRGYPWAANRSLTNVYVRFKLSVRKGTGFEDNKYFYRLSANFIRTADNRQHAHRRIFMMQSSISAG